MVCAVKVAMHSLWSGGRSVHAPAPVSGVASHVCLCVRLCVWPSLALAASANPSVPFPSPPVSGRFKQSMHEDSERLASFDTRHDGDAGEPSIYLPFFVNYLFIRYSCQYGRYDTTNTPRPRQSTPNTPMETSRIAHHAQKSPRYSVTACRVEAIMSACLRS